MRPNLTFFCELETPALTSLFQKPEVITALQKLHAGISLSIRDFSSERADVVRLLNRFSIPVSAWIALPQEQGNWTTIENANEVVGRYDLFKDWTVRYDLSWAAIGLDFEPDFHVLQKGFLNSWELLSTGIKHIGHFSRFIKTERILQELASRIKSDGFLLEISQFPFILDERIAKTNLVRYYLGLPKIKADREMFKLTSSFVRPYGAGFVWSYARDAHRIGIGSTGGSIELAGETQPLSWAEFERDLRLAWHWTNDITIFSLEGCVQQGFLEKLLDFEWDQLILEPLQQARKIDRWRVGFQMSLWLFSYTPVFFVTGLTLAIFIYSFARKR